MKDVGCVELRTTYYIYKLVLVVWIALKVKNIAIGETSQDIISFTSLISLIFITRKTIMAKWSLNDYVTFYGDVTVYGSVTFYG